MSSTKYWPKQKQSAVQDISLCSTRINESISGICPQHNVLYDNLTVAEHLWFFAKLKGINDKKLLEDEVNRLIDAVGLEDKRDVQTKKLSGGMKRKLSVGIALIGNSKVRFALFYALLFGFSDTQGSQHQWSKSFELCILNFNVWG